MYILIKFAYVDWSSSFQVMYHAHPRTMIPSLTNRCEILGDRRQAILPLYLLPSSCIMAKFKISLPLMNGNLLVLRHWTPISANAPMVGPLGEGSCSFVYTSRMDFFPTSCFA